MTARRISARLLAAAASLALVACAAPVMPAPAPAAQAAPAPTAPAAPAAAARASSRPPAECLQVLDRLSVGIPRDETGPALASKGLKIASSIQVPDGVVTETGITSGARVRVMIDRQGRVIPGSVTVQQSLGDPKLPLALSDSVPASLSFDVGGAFSVPQQFAFTTVFIVCARS